jgi:cation:H+ antiporter
MILEYLGILSGLLLLVFGADRFITGAAYISRHLGMPPLIIGMCIVGLFTSVPEILVGSVAAFGGKTEIAIGNAIGSNIANIGLVLGISVIIKPMVVASKTLRREYALMFLAAIIAFAFMWDRELNRLDAVLLLASLAAFTFLITRLARQSPVTDPLAREFKQELKQKITPRKSLLILFAGLILLLGGAELLVRCTVTVAQYYGISDLVIGLTIIAVGTSLPELAASIMSVLKNEPDIAIGNIIGSNMINMLAVIGIPVLIRPGIFSDDALLRDFPIMLGLTLLMGWMVFIHDSGRFHRKEGSVLLICFVAYQYWLIAGSTA